AFMFDVFETYCLYSSLMILLVCSAFLWLNL
ncbi:hypothetical protein EUTSA_v100002611mg, partial [Eutrema salsugineum]